MRLAVCVQARSSQEKIVQHQTFWKVYVHEPPVHERANEAVIKLLAKYFRVPASHVRLVKVRKVV